MEDILDKIKAFRDERDWMKFHDPKNLAISIAIEAAELLEHFQWKDEKAIEQHIMNNAEEIADEIADVAMYLIELADNLGINLIQAMENKLGKNAKKYPVAKAKGIATKYDKL